MMWAPTRRNKEFGVFPRGGDPTRKNIEVAKMRFFFRTLQKYEVCKKISGCHFCIEYFSDMTNALCVN